jgi:hypothetical protein
MTGLLAAGCQTSRTTGTVTLTPEKSLVASRDIVTWLECEECVAGELEAVVRLDQTAVPSLVASLREGPPSARREVQRRHLALTYRRLKLAMTEEQYVLRYVENYLALYRIRAAEALGAIGGPAATQALEDAAAEPFRDDVKAAVRAARTRLQKR